jgi:hypothetical protein
MVLAKTTIALTTFDVMPDPDNRHAFSIDSSIDSAEQVSLMIDEKT